MNGAFTSSGVVSARPTENHRNGTAKPGHVLLMFQPRVGGVPGYVANLADGLVERGWRVTVAAPTDTPMLEQLARSARVIELDTDSAISPRDFALSARLAAVCRRERVDLIHAHSSKAGALAFTTGALAGKPSIYSPHAWSFQREQSSLKKRAYEIVERTLMRGHRHAIAVADVERVDAVARRIVASDRIELIKTGLPDVTTPGREAARAELGLRHGRFAVGWVGRLGRQKRAEDLVALTDRLGESSGLIALGYGMAESDIGRKLLARGAMVRSNGLADSVYGAADALVVTSRWEASPFVVMEAMRAGLPVIAYDVGGIGDQVENGRTGFLVAPGDVAGLADHVLQLARDPIAVTTMGSRARRRYESHFGFERMIEQIVASYADVLAGARTRR